MAFVTDRVPRLVEVRYQPGSVVKAFPPRYSQPEVVPLEVAAQPTPLRLPVVKIWAYRRCPIDSDPVAAWRYEAAVRERQWAVFESRQEAEPVPSRVEQAARPPEQQRLEEAVEQWGPASQ